MKCNNVNCCNLFSVSQQNTAEAAFCSAIKSSTHRDTSCRSPATPICKMPSQRENKKSVPAAWQRQWAVSIQPSHAILSWAQPNILDGRLEGAGRALGECLHCESHSQGWMAKWGSVKCETPSSLPVLQITKSIIRAVTRTDESPMLKPNWDSNSMLGTFKKAIWQHRKELL